MLISSKRKIRLGYAVAFLLLLFSYFLLFYSTRQMRKTEQWVSHTSMVLAQLEGLKAAIAEAEAGARGYIITKDEKFLTPYTNSLQNLPSINKKLRELTSDNKDQQLKLDIIDSLIKKRLSLFVFGLTSFRESGFTITPAMEVNWQDSRVTTESIRLLINQMKNNEEELLDQRKAKLSGLSSNVQALIIISLITAVLAILYSLLLYNHENRKANEYREKLEENIRQLKTINEELKELRSLEKFASTGRVARTIAHEVRNPLTNITLAREQLQELTTQDKESSLLLDMINRNAVRINQLVSDLLNATKSIDLTMQHIHINWLLDQALEMAGDRLELKHITVEKDYAHDLCEVAVDIEKIKFAFLNIIVNAIEAMETDNSVLRIKTKKEKDKCVIEISDTGKGMDDETLQKIFEPYFTGKQKGTGLGLTNTQNIILSHKGSIKVQSQPGKGSTFIITLDIK